MATRKFPKKDAEKVICSECKQSILKKPSKVRRHFKRHHPAI